MEVQLKHISYRVSHAHGAYVCVGFGSILRLAAAESLGRSVQLNVHLKSNNCFEAVHLHGFGNIKYFLV